MGSNKKDKHFYSVLTKFNKSSPENYKSISLEVCRLTHGPNFPFHAFESIHSLIEWYRAILLGWLENSLISSDIWGPNLTSSKQKLALLNLSIESRNTGIRFLHRKIFRDIDNMPRDLNVSNYRELGIWCDFMFEILNDDDNEVDCERNLLTLRHDKGSKYRDNELRKETEKEFGEFAAAFAHSAMREISKAKPQIVEPDDRVLLVVWSSLVNQKETLREVIATLFIEAKIVPKAPHQLLLEDIIATTWKMMRSLGPVCHKEPHVKGPLEVRKHLDSVKLFCTSQLAPLAKEEDFVSCKNSFHQNNLLKWAGGEIATLAIVFTDIVNSTALEETIKSEAMKKVRKNHFARARKLIEKYKGKEVKTIGDSFLVVFKSVDLSLDFALHLHKHTGSKQVRIRAGIHTGPIHIDENDIQGSTVNFAARVVGAISGPEVWLSREAKNDIDKLSAIRHSKFKWNRHDNVSMKGFSTSATLWELERP